MWLRESCAAIFGLNNTTAKSHASVQPATIAEHQDHGLVLAFLSDDHPSQLCNCVGFIVVTRNCLHVFTKVTDRAAVTPLDLLKDTFMHAEVHKATSLNLSNLSWDISWACALWPTTRRLPSAAWFEY
jgi:hypothetical protein